MFKRFGTLAVFLTIFGCGGLIDNGTKIDGYVVIPKNADLAVNGTVEIAVEVIDTSANSYQFSVAGGSRSGSIVPESSDPSKAIYTAPSTAGDYVVYAGYVDPVNESFQTPVTIHVH